MYSDSNKQSVFSLAFTPIKEHYIRCSSLQLVLVSAAFFTIFFNIGFFKKTAQALGMDIGADYLLLASFVCFIFCFFNILFSLLLIGILRKPLLVVLICCSAIGSYFSLFYSTYIDDDMITNIVQTNSGEALTLLNIKLIVWFIILGVVPSLIVIFLVNLEKTTILHACVWRIANIMISFIILITIYLTLAGGYSFFLKNHRQYLKLISPVNYMYAIGSYLNALCTTPLSYLHLGEDATRQYIAVNRKKRLVIVVVGETSRAQNFSLNGYQRETNPLLKQQTNIFSFEHATSCGTATAISVPCMFSNMTRKDFDRNRANSQDNVLDILARAGINVFWKENDTNCKEVCNRITTQEINKIEPREFCPAGLCYDIRLLNNLDTYIRHLTDDAVIVLHTNGSHGPAYFQRYQKAQEKFTPTCNTVQIDNCSKDQLLNVYDNTIVNVDYVLNSTIELLKKQTDHFSTAMFYMSDHGESLGESGFYLHGAPYRIAPKEQIQIPMIFWLSDAFMQELNINSYCLVNKARNDKVSHDNLFHTLLGSMGVATKEYKADLDIFNGCKE